MSDARDFENWAYSVERVEAQWRRVSMRAKPRFPKWANDYEEVASPQWGPAGDRIAFVSPAGGYSWFSPTGKVVVADADGSNRRVVAQNGEIPTWSPDGKRLGFARCRVDDDDDRVRRRFADKAGKCSLFTVPADGSQSAEMLVERAASPPFWSPDGNFIAFFRQVAECETYCRYRIFIAPSTGGASQQVGPELVEPGVDLSGSWSWPGLAWLPEAAPVVVPVQEEARGDELELQRCVDIWNRARMIAWPIGVVNVSLVGDLCQITVGDYGGVCTQIPEMRFRFWCPSHGANLSMLPPEIRVWNAHGEKDGRVSLFDPPKGERLPLPKAPPYSLLDGYVIPFDKDGEPLADLNLTETEGTCLWGEEPDPYPLAYPDGYPVQCGWDGSGSRDCFKRPGRLSAGDIVLCPQAFWREAYDPMRFVKVKVKKFE